LQRLTVTLNAMLDRIEASFNKITNSPRCLSRFAHAVAVIRTSAELALRRQRTEPEYREALHQIWASIENIGAA